jgi:hypothetical protein
LAQGWKGVQWEVGAVVNSEWTGVRYYAIQNKNARTKAKRTQKADPTERIQTHLDFPEVSSQSR